MAIARQCAAFAANKVAQIVATLIMVQFFFTSGRFSHSGSQFSFIISKFRSKHCF